tara:strand:+ start:28705 stop:29160 length:456 start_codon:yes stop_codon:yes gene_type:complete
MVQEDKEYPKPIEVEESAFLRSKGKMVIVLMVLLGAFGYLTVMAFQSATVYYYTVGELKDNQTHTNDSMLRVSGKLVEDSFVRERDSIEAKFMLTDGTETIDAIHLGILPDLFFNEHSEIILEGTFGDDKVFISSNVIVKCPSKYVEADVD